MRRLSSSILFLTFLFAFPLTACAPEPQPATEIKQGAKADVDAIHDLYKRFDDAVNTGECEAVLDLLTDDVFYMVPNRPVLKGRDAVRARVVGACDQFDMEHITDVQEVQIGGDWSFALAKVTFRVTPKAGGETTEEIDKLISIQERQVDGSWEIARIIWNSDNPPPQ